MSDYYHDEFESAADTRPARPGQLSSNGQWMFGSLFAGLILVGFAFGVITGAQHSSKAKPTELADAKKKEGEKPVPQPVAQPQPPKVKEPEPKVKEPEPKVKEPEPKMKEKEPEPEMKPEPKKPEIKPAPKPKEKEPEPKKPDVKPVAFKEIQPILNGYCGNCHGLAGKPKGGVDLRTVAAIMKGGNDGEIVKPGDPKKSRLYASVAEQSMPPDGKPGPNPKELQLIHDWILSGAK